VGLVQAWHREPEAAAIKILPADGARRTELRQRVLAGNSPGDTDAECRREEGPPVRVIESFELAFRTPTETPRLVHCWRESKATLDL
jgi:hypothetical protein